MSWMLWEAIFEAALTRLDAGEELSGMRDRLLSPLKSGLLIQDRVGLGGDCSDEAEGEDDEDDCHEVDHSRKFISFFNGALTKEDEDCRNTGSVCVVA